MADIIESSNKNSITLLENFRKNVEILNQNFKKRLKSKIKISLGDEFQCITKDLKTAVEIIFAMNELTLKSENEHYNLRYVIHYGKIETEISDELPMLGSGLSEARTMLTSLKKENFYYRINLGEKMVDESRILSNSFIIYQYFWEQWKPKDFGIISGFLDKKNYKDIAKKFNLDVSTSWRREKSLNILEFNTIKNIILQISEK